MTCRKICEKYRVSKPYGQGYYQAGFKRCQICDLFIKFDGIRCPCCGYKLRLNPRNATDKERLQRKNGVRRI